MKIFSTAAIIALAGTGLVAQSSASLAERFQNIHQEVGALMSAMNYSEAIKKLEAIIPATTPNFVKDPEDPSLAYNSFIELSALQDMYVSIGQAFVMNGETEKAIASFQKAEEIAGLIAGNVEEALAPLIENWNGVIPVLTKNLEDIGALKEEKTGIEKQKAELEAKRRRTRDENRMLAAMTERLTLLNTVLPQLDEQVPAWEENLQRAPEMVDYFNQRIADAKENTTRFSPAIQGLQQDLNSENELITGRFNGNKTRYVDSVISTEANLASIQNNADKVKFLNRLLFLDPNNNDVKQHLSRTLGR
jgi:tetratricopeptide (TPR) repeat protein